MTTRTNRRGIRRTLYGRLSNALLLLFATFGVFYVNLTVRTARNYANEVNQQLHYELARRLVDTVPTGPDRALSLEGVNRFFTSAMAINPTIELYLLDRDGVILTYAPTDAPIRRRQVDLAPLRSFLRGDRIPIVGDDPRNVTGRKVFSVAPMTAAPTSPDTGYLYIILGGQTFDSVMQLLRSSYILQLSAWVFGAGLVFWLVAALVTFNVMTRRLTRLTKAMDTFQQQGFPESGGDALEARPDGDEIDQLIQVFALTKQRLAELVERLQKREAARLEFVANVAHDLRSPLATLQAYVEALGEDQRRLTPDERQEYFEMVTKHTQRLGKLVSELLQLAILESEDTRITTEPLSLRDLAQDVYLGLKLAAEQRRVRYELSLPDDSCDVSGDISLLERAIENLIDNALHHTAPEGTVTVRVAASPDRVLLAVSDTGRGIAEKDLPFILDRLYRGADKPHPAGVGLGLAIVSRILDMHGSTLKVVTAVDAGSEFSFELPRLRPPSVRFS